MTSVVFASMYVLFLSIMFLLRQHEESSQRPDCASLSLDSAQRCDRIFVLSHKIRPAILLQRAHENGTREPEERGYHREPDVNSLREDAV